MSHHLRLLQRGEWLLGNHFFHADAPFAVLTVNFQSKTGTARVGFDQETPLSEILRSADNRFSARYRMNQNNGRLEAEYSASDGSLKIKFTGTVNTECTGNVVNLEEQSSLPPDMTTKAKLTEAITRALPLIPEDARDEVKAMLQPEAIAIMVTVLAVFAGAQFFGVGEIADVIMLIVGGLMLGASALDVAKEVNAFAMGAMDAQTDDDLNEAAAHFAQAVIKGGVTLISAILLKKMPETFKEGKVFKPNAAPTTPGKLFYKPTIVQDASLGAGAGYTTEYGDIVVSSQGAVTDQKLALFHEKVHAFLTPKFQFLRDIRVTVAMNGYEKSYLLKYMEEAMAETVAQFRVNGAKGILSGIRFPVDGGYVTVAKMASEAKGVLFGPVNVGGMIYQVIFLQDHSANSGPGSSQ